VKVFPRKDGLVVSRILTVGATERGEHVGLEFETGADQNFVVLVPFGLFQKLTLSLLTAGGIARREQVARLGSDGNVLSVAGFSAFRPTGCDLVRGQLTNGEEVVLLRLKKDSLAVIDVAMSVDDAGKMATDILAKIVNRTTQPRSVN
jgi:hypothetical protein